MCAYNMLIIKQRKHVARVSDSAESYATRAGIDP